MTPGGTPRAGEPALTALESAAARRPPVALAEVLRQAELLTRVDRSYLVPAGAFPGLAAALGGFRTLTIEGLRVFRYRSVYYDTPCLRSFRDHRQGRRRRFKVRERLYADTGERQLEVKLKGRRGETVKHRRRLAPDEYALGPAGREFVAAVLGGTYGTAPPAVLLPTLVTFYVRATFVAEGCRVTCDAALACRDLHTGAEVRADGGVVLVETKSAGRPTAADRLLYERGIRPAECTKYCVALAGLHPGLGPGRWSRSARILFPPPADQPADVRPARRPAPAPLPAVPWAGSAG